MKRIKFLLLSLAAASLTTSAQKEADYNNIVSALVADCPEIKQFVATEKADIESRAAGNILENPTVEGQHVWGREGTKYDIGVSQEFAWPGVYRARAKALKAGMRASELLEQSLVADKILEIEQLVIDIVYQKKAVEIESRILEHMTALEKGNIEGYNHGELTLLDLKKVEIERIATASALREAKRKLDELYTTLETVTGRHDCRTLIAGINEVPQASILPESDYEQLIENYDPRLAWLRAQNDAIRLDGKAEVLAARAPGFSLGYAFVSELGDSFNGLSASISLPVYSRRHTVASANAKALSVEIEAETTRMTAIANMRSLRTSVTSMQAELNDYNTVFGDDDYAHLLTIARQGGELSNLQYLQELNFFLDAARSRLALEHEYVRSLAALNRFRTISDR